MKTVPDGKDETSNELIRSWGEKTVFDFEPKDHIELGNNLGLLDLDKASEISGSRFSVLNGKLANLPFRTEKRLPEISDALSRSNKPRLLPNSI